MDERTIRCRYCSQLNRIPSREETAGVVCGRCRLPLSDAPHKKFEGLDPHSYVHPLDSQALAALKAIPGIDTILKKFLSLTFESYARVSFNASAVRISAKQCPDLNAKLEVAAVTLGLPRPELFVSVSDLVQGGVGYNAYTTGYEKPFVVVNSLLLERLTDEEVLSVLGHELGHIHSQHMLYRAAAITLVLLARFAMLSSPVTAGIATLLTLPIQAALLNWYQKSELSADRAALLVVQNPDVVVSTLVKLAGGTFASQIDREEFVEQAKEFQKNYDEHIMDKFWALVAAAQQTHPFAVWRVSEVLSWVESGQYRRVLEGTKKLPQ